MNGTTVGANFSPRTIGRATGATAAAPQKIGYETAEIRRIN